MDQLISIAQEQIVNLHMPTLRWTDVVEIFIISFVVYHIMLWVKNTRAWSLLKGIAVIMLFIMLAAIFNMSTILWITENILGLAVIAAVVVLQPELRRALEQIGRANIISDLLKLDSSKNEEGLFSDWTMKELVRASFEMGQAKTGALIVIEQRQLLDSYENTGIGVDGIVSRQLLVNIFEHNTPLHDGAVIIRGNRVAAATCYLPLSDKTDLSKELGTRHRAGVGISEVTDSLTIIVSEETGSVSVAYEGELYRNLNNEGLVEKLTLIQNKPTGEKKFRIWKGRKAKDEGKTDSQS